jgi:hypothetical protein
LHGHRQSRAVNLGTNRWSVRPELGVSRALDALTLEVKAGASLFTNNRNFLDGSERVQAPIYYMQGHVIYSFGAGYWASADLTYFTGGRTTVDGEIGNDLQRNWPIGATLAVPLDWRYSLKLGASRGVPARTGNDYDLVGVALQYR